MIEEYKCEKGASFNYDDHKDELVIWDKNYRYWVRIDMDDLHEFYGRYQSDTRHGT